MWRVILGLTLIATPALADHTKDAVIYDANSKIILMVIIPDDDKQLNDPAFNTKGTVQVQVTHMKDVEGADQIDAAINQVIGLKGPREVAIDPVAAAKAILKLGVVSEEPLKEKIK